MCLYSKIFNDADFELTFISLKLQDWVSTWARKHQKVKKRFDTKVIKFIPFVWTDSVKWYI